MSRIIFYTLAKCKNNADCQKEEICTSNGTCKTFVGNNFEIH